MQKLIKIGDKITIGPHTGSSFEQRTQTGKRDNESAGNSKE